MQLAAGQRPNLTGSSKRKEFGCCEFLPTEAPSSVGHESITSSSSTWRLRTSITPGPKPEADKLTASANGFTRRCCKSFIKSRFVKSSTIQLSSCRQMSISGCKATTKNDLTVEGTASVRRRDKSLMIQKSRPNKKCSTNSYNPVHNLGNTCQIKYWLLQLKRS